MNRKQGAAPSLPVACELWLGVTFMIRARSPQTQDGLPNHLSAGVVPTVLVLGAVWVLGWTCRAQSGTRLSWLGGSPRLPRAWGWNGKTQDIWVSVGRQQALFFSLWLEGRGVVLILFHSPQGTLG